MNVDEMIARLLELQAAGLGSYELLDTDANPIISATVSDDDEENNMRRVYIESEF